MVVQLFRANTIMTIYENEPHTHTPINEVVRVALTTTYKPHLSITAISVTLHHFLSSSADQGGSAYNRIVRSMTGADLLLKSFLLSPKTGPDKWPSDAPRVCVMVMVVVHRLHHIHEHHKWSAQIENQEHVILEYTSGTQFLH